jgi:hypothetical protein
MLDRDGLLVVGQRIRRGPTQPPQRGVQAGHQGAQLAVQGRQHHPEPRPRQPRAEQQRRTWPAVGSEHDRCSTPVELQPQPRLGDPRPILTTPPGLPRLLGFGDRAAGGPLVTGEPQPLQPLMHHIGPDRAVGPVHPLLDLGQERVDDLRPLNRPVDRPASSRAATYRRTVLASTPTKGAAECAHPVASKASRISMISLSDFFTVPPRGPLVSGQRPRALPRRDPHLGPTRPVPDSLEREISYPRRGR